MIFSGMTQVSVFGFFLQKNLTTSDIRQRTYIKTIFLKKFSAYKSINLRKKKILKCAEIIVNVLAHSALLLLYHIVLTLVLI